MSTAEIIYDQEPDTLGNGQQAVPETELTLEGESK